jgi:copper chaperone CopZ
MKPTYVILLLTGLFLTSLNESFAGIKWADIGVNGLTCSLCSRSVEMSLRRLDFVDSVGMSLETTEGRVYFKSNLPINLDQVAKAVVRAGFSVRFLKVEFTFDDIAVNHDGSFVYQGQTFEWLDFKNKPDKKPVALKLVDENFLPKKESNQWKKKFATTASGSQKVLHVSQEG